MNHGLLWHSIFADCSVIHGIYRAIKGIKYNDKPLSLIAIRSFDIDFIYKVPHFTWTGKALVVVIQIKRV